MALSKKTEDQHYVILRMTSLKYAKKDFNLEMFNALEFIKVTFLVSRVDLDALPNIARL
jgi:hypothetical protein